MKVVIIGGGTAGWMAAAYLAKKGKQVTLIESPDIKKIGVGESVTPHLKHFFDEIGIDEKDWMKKTNAVMKLSNEFSNWVTNTGEYDYFSFNYTTNENIMFRDLAGCVNINDFCKDANQIRNIDHLAYHIQNKNLDKFDRYFYPHYHYMERNVAPFIDDTLILNQPYSYSQHINAEMAADYIRDEIALPLGVKHILKEVTKVNTENDEIKSILAGDEIVTGDYYVDATGFKKLLVNKLGWKSKYYENIAIDSAWVTQTQYENKEDELINHTKTIAEPYGWRFKVCLYHRMGNGYCYSSSHISDDEAGEYFSNIVKTKNIRLIKWKPSRLETFGNKNTAAIGLSCGFIEPLEANALYSVVTSIRLLNKVIDKNDFNWKKYNEKISYALDDIADFILVHYTKSQRKDTNFWKDLTSLKLNHNELILDKINSPYNSTGNSISGYSVYPDYMWLQLALAWGIDVKLKEFDKIKLHLSKMHFEYNEKKHRFIAYNGINNYQWHKEYIFDGLD